MSLVAECEQKPQNPAPKSTISESKMIVDTINAHFKFFDGTMDARLLWHDKERVRFRVNWWTTGGNIVKSSFVVLKKQGDTWIVERAS